jgi:hypothetical protein
MLGRREAASASILVKRRIIKLAVIAGTIGPILFGAVLLVALPAAAFMSPLVRLAGWCSYLWS